jgi:hypothetical protein
MEIPMHRVSISKEQLLALTMNETKFFILITQLANEFSILRKLIIVSAEISEDAEVQLQDQADAFQVMCLLRIIAGKLYEANKVIDEYFVKRNVKDGYRNIKELNDALGKITAYMVQKPNLLEHIRNNYSFHHTDDDDSIPRMIKALPEKYEFHNYFGPSIATTFFYGSEHITVSSMLNEVFKDLDNKAEIKIPAVQKELLMLMSYFDEFVSEYVACLVTRLREREEWARLGDLKSENFVLHGPDIMDVHVPYFIGGNPRNKKQ